MIRAVFFDFYGTLADWPAVEDLQQEAAAAEGVAVDRANVASGYQAANAYLDEENAKHPVQRRTQQERDSFFAEYERRLLADAGAPDVSLDVAARIWQRVRSTSDELTLFSDAKSALADLRALGLTLGVISNIGFELDALLQRLGIAEYLPVRSTVASSGVSKPHPRIFRMALAQAGAQPAEAVHIGDSIGTDVEGACNAGLAAVLVQRVPGPRAPEGVCVVRSLTEAATHVQSLPGMRGMT